MSDRDDDKKKKKKNYKVGYSKPPKHSQFKKGESGNPKGRPKGAKNKKLPSDEAMSKMILDEGQRLVDIKDGSEVTPTSMSRAIVRSTNYKAVKGSVPAARLSLSLSQAAQDELNQGRIRISENIRTYRCLLAKNSGAKDQNNGAARS